MKTWYEDSGHNSSCCQRNNSEDYQLPQSEEAMAKGDAQGVADAGDGITDGSHGDTACLGNLLDRQPLVVEELPHLALCLW